MRSAMKAILVLGLALLLCAGPPLSSGWAEEAQGAAPALTLAQGNGPVRATIGFEATGLAPNKPVKLIWMTVDGSYKLEGVYTVIGSEYTPREEVLLQGRTDEQGNWQGMFRVPEGFGGDHTLYIRQNNAHVAQNVFFVNTTFKMTPESGPVGSAITIEVEGLGWSTMESDWQLTYDNKFTGLISAVSTDGKAKATIRAAGPVGKHTLTVWHGYLGMPYMNHQQAPTAYLPVPTFTFEVTEGEPAGGNFVEAPPEAAADGGVVLPAAQNKPGVEVAVSREAGIVGDPVTLTASGLPAGQRAELIWNTMRGNRISAEGFAESQSTLGEAEIGEDGRLARDFVIPEDLGGIPHRIDVKVNGEIYGQTFLRINPSIVSMSPMSGPVGTEITIRLQGVGWTEFDNAYYLTYDNAYTGYMCGFNSQGTVEFTIIAAGEPGYHLIDLYPGIYRGERTTPDVYLAPQLTYGEDHPGSRIPAIRMGFEMKAVPK